MSPAVNEVSIASLRAEAETLTAGLSPGEPLDNHAASLITLAAAVSVTALDRIAVNAAVARAFAAGASVAQIQEIVGLTSGLGAHSLMVSAVVVLDEAARRGLADPLRSLDAQEQLLWNRHVGTDPFWESFSEELPGFLEAMLRLSPDIFVGFFEYSAIPWRSRTVRAKVKELAALACVAASSHRFRPGFRIHAKNAIKLGVGTTAIFQTLDIAAAAPQHRGTD